MKKFTKITLIAAGVCIVLGMSLVIGAGIFGERYYKDLDVEIGSYEEQFDEILGFMNGDHSGNEKNKEYHNIRIAGNEIKELDINVKAASLNLLTDDKNDGITIVDSSDSLDISHRVDEDTLYLEIQQKKGFASSGIASSVTLTVPNHVKFDEVSIQLSAASLEAENVRTEELDLNLNASSARINGMEAGKLDAECNASSMNVNGSVENEMEVDCHAGKAELCLNGKYEDFNYEIDSRAGSVYVEDKEYSSLKSKVSFNYEGAKKNMDLNCNAGEIVVQFTK